MDNDLRDVIGIVLGLIIGGIIVYFGMSCNLKTNTDKELISSVCEYIYENESEEIYLKYCK